MSATIFYDREQIRNQLRECFIGPCEIFHCRRWLKSESDQLAPITHVFSAIGRHVEKIRNNLKGDGESKVINQFHSTAFCSPVKDIVNELLNTWTQTIDGSWCECFTD